jgi:hypothetical protein
LREAHFQSVNEEKSKMADLLNRMSADVLQRCFDQWKVHMQQCVDRVEYVEGDRNEFARL